MRNVATPLVWMFPIHCGWVESASPDKYLTCSPHQHYQPLTATKTKFRSIIAAAPDSAIKMIPNPWPITDITHQSGRQS